MQCHPRMKRLSPALISMLFVMTACQGSKTQQEFDTAHADSQEVVGGTNVEFKDQLTNMALSLRVGYQNKGESTFTVYQCTATALSKNIVLTAAHCIGATADYTQIELRDSAGQITAIKAKAAYVHAGYEKDKEDDLALIELATDLPATVQKLAMPILSKPIIPTQIKAAGYGRKTGVQGQPGELNVLRTADLNVRDFALDKKIFSVDQEQGKGICQGDSGGPAMVKQNGKIYIVGVVSKTRFWIPDDKEKPVDQCNYLGEYVNLQQPELKAWIFQVGNRVMGHYKVPENIAKTVPLK